MKGVRNLVRSPKNQNFMDPQTQDWSAQWLWEGNEKVTGLIKSHSFCLSFQVKMQCFIPKNSVSFYNMECLLVRVSFWLPERLSSFHLKNYEWKNEMKSQNSLSFSQILNSHFSPREKIRLTHKKENFRNSFRHGPYYKLPQTLFKR